MALSAKVNTYSAEPSSFKQVRCGIPTKSPYPRLQIAASLSHLNTFGPKEGIAHVLGDPGLEGRLLSPKGFSFTATMELGPIKPCSVWPLGPTSMLAVYLQDQMNHKNCGHVLYPCNYNPNWYMGNEPF